MGMASGTDHAAAAPDRSDPLPAPPDVIVTRDGQRVDTTTAQWRMRTAAHGGTVLTIDWTLLNHDLGSWLMPERDREIFQRYVASVIASRAAHTAVNVFTHVRHVIRWYVQTYADRATADRVFTWRGLTPDELIALGHVHADRPARGHYFMQVRALYAWGTWTARLPDFDPAATIRLAAVRAQGNVRGAAVRSRHVEHGPLSADETRALDRALAGQIGEPSQRAIVMLIRELGLGARALAALQNRHLHRRSTTDGETGASVRTYWVDVPAATREQDDVRVRRRPVSHELGELLWRLRHGPATGRLLYWLDARRPEAAVRAAVTAWARCAKLMSPRTGTPLTLHPRRLRHTFATELARRGYSRRAIAEGLGHRDLQHVEAYIEASSDAADPATVRLDPAYAPLVERFVGVPARAKARAKARVATRAARVLERVGTNDRVEPSSWPGGRRGGPDAQVPAAQGAEALIARARAAMGAFLPSQDFDDGCWDLEPRSRRRIEGGGSRLHFTTHGSTVEPLPRSFGDVIRGLVVVEDLKNAAALQMVAAARRLWQAVAQRRGSRAGAFAWCELVPEDVTAAEDLLRREQEAATVAKDVRVLRALLAKLAVHGVVAPTAVPFRAGGTRSKVMAAALDPATRLARLPSARAIGGLADIYRVYAVREWDQIMAAVAALHVATGLRTIEILTLPYDCVVTDRAAGERQYGLRQYGLRYSREDPRARQLVATVQTLTPMQARIALPAVRRLRRLTALARAQARLLERSATSMTLDRVLHSPDGTGILPAPAGDTLLSTQVAAALLGCADYTAVHGMIKRLRIPSITESRRGRRPRVLVRASDLAAALQRERERKTPATVRGLVSFDDGTVQRLSESLLLVFVGQSHADPMASPYLVGPITAAMLDAWLGGKWERVRHGATGAGRAPRSGEVPVERNGRLMAPNIKSVFMRLHGTAAMADGSPIDLRDGDGEIIELDAQDLGRWVRTVAAFGGVDDVTFTRWQAGERM